MLSEETRWWWIRHAPVPDGGRIYGQKDLDCDCSAVDVFSALAQILPPNAVWLTSGLKRTHQTAAAIRAAGAYGTDGTDPVVVPEFDEQNLGDWQGLLRAEFLATRHAAGHPFWFSAASERAPGGESFFDLFTRTAAAVQRLTDEFRGRDIIAVTHGGTIRAALAGALNIAPDIALAFVIDNCSVTRLDHLGNSAAGPWRVGAVNRLCTAHTGGHAGPPA